MSTLERFHKGDRTALSKVISYVENQSPDYRKVLAQLYPKTGKAYRVGFTGPPGAGKSTIVDKLTSLLVKDENRVGIIAVDPTSPFTGGALLGDRIRMQDLTSQKGVFIRSMATRGSYGGLATSTKDVALVMDAFGKNYILIETVGVGQVELDVVNACDTTVVVLVPESGDSIQAMKAGLMEIADIFVVNKADREGANRIVTELDMILDIRREKGDWEYPIVSTEAVNNKGIDLLLSRITEHKNFIIDNHHFEKHRKEQIKSEIKKIIELKIRDMIGERVLVSMDLNDLAEKVFSGEDDPYSAGERILSQINIST
ncbi:MAG: methylmalonyl Co-A mutase-associated GTPase MeaB [candidate division Zixibacteria bacterium]|nr:methylmalonyl Co-A mutase-associated GTPase MeaB [candidate division Zixibacteria bacterium]